MGALTTIAGFAAGYVLGANRDAPSMKRAQTQLRGIVSQRLPGGSGTIRGSRSVSDIMTPMPERVTPDASVLTAARRMADESIGDVLVAEADGTLIGIVTDHDVAIRAVAAERDPRATSVREIVSGDPETVAPSDTVEVASARMRAANVRRLPIVENGRVVGIVSLGDLSLATDAGGTLADITVAPPDR